MNFMFHFVYGMSSFPLTRPLIFFKMDIAPPSSFSCWAFEPYLYLYTLSFLNPSLAFPVFVDFVFFSCLHESHSTVGYRLPSLVAYHVFFVLSSNIMISDDIISCHVVSCHVVSCHVISHRIISCSHVGFLVFMWARFKIGYTHDPKLGTI